MRILSYLNLVILLEVVILDVDVVTGATQTREVRGVILLDVDVIATYDIVTVIQ